MRRLTRAGGEFGAFMILPVRICIRRMLTSRSISILRFRGQGFEFKDGLAVARVEMPGLKLKARLTIRYDHSSTNECASQLPGP
jgi:hypothetical protein